MVIHLAINIFNRNPGLQFLARWAHVVVGIVWIGILYYFNFVQTPAFAEEDAGVRNVNFDKLVSRALWWFRWAAAATLLTGLLILLAEVDLKGNATLFSGDYYKSAEGISIATGILLAVTMFLNVWLVIWPNQRKVIANARNVLAGGQADPAAADSARRGALASRQNTIYSIPMLLFMVGTANFFAGYNTSDSGNRGGYWAVTVVIWAVLELSALGIIGGRQAGNVTNWIYENHWRAIATGVVLSGVWYALWEIFF
jgi:uncharacterized membrane protein